MTRSARLDHPETVRAVDRAIHPRLEGDLGLVPARRADDCEVLPHRTVVASLIATRSANLPNVIAPVPSGAAAGSAARAPLRIRGESLLRLELLVGGRVDELDPAIDA